MAILLLVSSTLSILNFSIQGSYRAHEDSKGWRNKTPPLDIKASYKRVCGMGYSSVAIFGKYSRDTVHFLATEFTSLTHANYTDSQRISIYKAVGLKI